MFEIFQKVIFNYGMIVFALDGYHKYYFVLKENTIIIFFDPDYHYKKQPDSLSAIYNSISEKASGLFMYRHPLFSPITKRRLRDFLGQKIL